MPIEEYIAECYVRACKVAYMKNENNLHRNDIYIITD